MPKSSCAGELARDLVAARGELRRAAQVLHDDVGSLSAVAGLRLQLMRMDLPALDGRAAEVGDALDGVMQHLRALTRALEPTSVRRTGLKNALLDLAQARLEATGADTVLRYTATAVLEPAIADAVYGAIATAAASAGDERISLRVTGARSVAVKVAFEGRPRQTAAAMAAARLLASHAGIAFSVELTKKGTIVSISHAIQRTSRGRPQDHA